LLKEAVRVSKDFIIIKDHVKSGFYSEIILKYMDSVGNNSKGVPLPFNYLTRTEWDLLFAELDLHAEFYTNNLHLYPIPFNSLFDRNLHFFTKLKIGVYK
jgi:hypothetical protein